MVTIGSRQSELYGRIYDKEQESGAEEYAGCVRYEVEVKGDQAHKLGEYLGQCDFPRIEAFKNVVGFFEARGAIINCDAPWEGMAMPKVVLRRTNEQAVKWIETQVSPTIDRLCKAGYNEDVARALLAAQRQSADFGAKVRRLSQMLFEEIGGE
jgi:DNA relaxase NicK